MKRVAMLACVLFGWFAWPTVGQDAPPQPPASQALAAIHAPGEIEPDAAQAATQRLRDAMAGLTNFESLDDSSSVAGLIRVLVTASSIGPGVSVAVLEVAPDADDPTTSSGLRVVARLRGERTDELSSQVGGFSAGDNVVFVDYADAVTTIWFDTTGDAKRPDASDPLEPFADHRPEATDGLELMLDLEGLRRAWPQSLADGPARRVVAVTGLANARKIHVHLPAQGTARIAYSSRALPAERISTRTGPSPEGDARVGVRWPIVFDAGLRLYAVALEDEPRQAFGQRFQAWMGVHGNRLRGIIQALDTALDWSVTPTDDGLRTSFEMPVRQGVQFEPLREAFVAALGGSGFEVENDGGTLTLPESAAAALGGGTLAVTLERGEGEDDAARFVLTIE